MTIVSITFPNVKFDLKYFLADFEVREAHCQAKTFYKTMWRIKRASDFETRIDPIMKKMY